MQQLCQRVQSARPPAVLVGEQNPNEAAASGTASCVASAQVIFVRMPPWCYAALSERASTTLLVGCNP